MKRYLLDANHLSPLVTIGHPLRLRVQRQFEVGDHFAITGPVLSEFLYGLGSLPRAEQNWREWQLIRADFDFYEIDSAVAEGAARLRLRLRARGWQLTLVDALTAVVALRNDLCLLTTDRDFDALPELERENWRL